MTYSANCCAPSGRRYFSRAEKKEWLESYAQDLEAELKGVRERIKDIEAA